MKSFRSFCPLTIIIAFLNSFLPAQLSGAEKQDAAPPVPPPPKELQQSGPDLVELSLGYNYINLADNGVSNLHGLSASAFFNVTSWLGLGGEFMVGYGSHSQSLGGGQNLDSKADREIYLFGVRPSFWPTSRLRLFGQALAGSAHGYDETTFFFFRETVSADAFAMAFGGGADWQFARHFSWRIVEADYLPTNFNNQWQNNWRVSTALVFTFGRRD